MLIAGVDGNGNVHPFLLDEHGHLIIIIRNDDGAVRKIVTLADTDETTIWDPTSGMKFVVTDVLVSVDNNAQITFRDGTAGTVILIHRLLQNMSHGHHFRTPLVSTTADNILTAQASAANAFITVTGYEI